MPSLAVPGRADLTDAQWARSAPRLPREEDRPPVEMDETPVHRRHPVAGPHGYLLVGRPVPVRTVADGVRDVPALATRWTVGTDPDGIAGTRRRCRRHRVGRRRRLGHRGPINMRPGSAGTAISSEQGRKPLSIVVTAGQRGDSPRFTAVGTAVGTGDI